jgi:signal transduction histidine kinase
MNSLYQRLTLTHTLVALLAVILVALFAGILIGRSYAALAAQRAQVTAQTVRTVVVPLYENTNGDWDQIARRFQRLIDTAPENADRRILLADENWQIQLDSLGQFRREVVPLRFRQQAVPIDVRGMRVGYVIVPIGGEGRTPAERQFIRSITFIIIFGSIIAGTVALVTALLMARRLVAPLRSLTSAANRLSAGEQHTPIAEPDDREFADLARAFNQMAAEIERQETLRRTMLSDITHELRTPLSVLRLQLESIEDGIEQPTPALMASLTQEVGLLERLIDDLRLLALADAGQLTLNCEPVAPRSTIDHLAHHATPRARQQGITLHIEPVVDVPDVYADPQRLTQVLVNLVENALRYTPRGGTITLRSYHANGHPARAADAPRRGAVHTQQPATSWVVFEVTDTGTGIAPEDLPRIFDRFYRTDRARARETGGSGLGLAIVERLVHAHTGRVTVDSTLGQGTTFAVWLPTTRPALTAQS